MQDQEEWVDGIGLSSGLLRMSDVVTVSLPISYFHSMATRHAIDLINTFQDVGMSQT